MEPGSILRTVRYIISIDTFFINVVFAHHNHTRVIHTDTHILNIMENRKFYDILQTSIIGCAYEACGIGFDIEDGLECYHIDEFSENTNPDDITGAYNSPEHFLEDLCGMFSGQVYEILYIMKSSWSMGKSTMHKHWQRRVCKKLWDLGKDNCIQYLSDFGEEEDIQCFLEKGEYLFGNVV